MATATKRTTTKRKRTAKQPTSTVVVAPVKRTMPFDPQAFYDQIGRKAGWGDPRITHYIQTNEERRKYVGHRNFTAQNLHGSVEFGDYIVTELGPFVDTEIVDSSGRPVAPVTWRIVEVRLK